MIPQSTRRGPFIGGCVAVGAAAAMLVATPAQANTEVERPDEFTSAFTAMANPDDVVDGDGEPTGGEEGASGDVMLWVNSDLDVICYDITLEGVTGDYDSPALTGTHIHEAAAGESGPPRIVFDDPQPIDDVPRTSSGCIEGPFVTGVEDDDGNDQGEGFTVAEIEADPADYYFDVHTEEHMDGAVRAQLTQVPLDGVETGGGGTAAQSSAFVPVAGAGAVALAGVGAFVLLRRNRREA